MNCHCCMMRESEDVFWHTFAAGGQQLDSPLWLMGKSMLHVVFNCFTGLGLSTIPFSWLVCSVYLGPAFGLAGCHGLHLSYLKCKAITWGLPPLHGSFWLKKELELNSGWLVVGCVQPSLRKWRKCLGLWVCIYFTFSQMCPGVQINNIFFPPRF